MAKVEQMLRLRYIEEFLRSRKKGASYKDIERYLVLSKEIKRIFVICLR